MNDAGVISNTSRSSRRIGRSISAVIAGLFTVVILSVGTDELLRVVGIFPPDLAPLRITPDRKLVESNEVRLGIRHMDARRHLLGRVLVRIL
jgi:hypothetical protein